MRYINIEKELIPYRFSMTFKQKMHEFEVNYNTEYDFFTLDLSIDGEIIVVGEKIVYGRPLFSSVDSFIHTLPRIIAYDLPREEERVTYENIGKKVFLYIEED